LCLHQCMDKVSLCKSIHPVERCSKLQLKLTGNYSCCWIYLAFYWYVSVSVSLSLSPSLSLSICLYSFTSFVVFWHYCFLYLVASFIHPFLPSFLFFSFLFYSVHVFLFFSLLFSSLILFFFYCVYLSIPLFLFFFSLSLNLSLSHSLALSINQSINQSINPASKQASKQSNSNYLSIYPSIYLSIYQTIFIHAYICTGFTHRKMMDTKKVKAGILGDGPPLEPTHISLILPPSRFHAPSDPSDAGIAGVSVTQHWKRKFITWQDSKIEPFKCYKVGRASWNRSQPSLSAVRQDDIGVCTTSIGCGKAIVAICGWPGEWNTQGLLKCEVLETNMWSPSS